MDDLRQRIGDPSQLASARAIRLTDGNEDGVRAVDVRVQGGIHALILVDRGLDIGPAWFAGQPLAWQSSTGIVHPAYFRDDTWLRSFHGGLLVTCGLQNVGAHNISDGVSYGLHGRLSNIPARAVSHRIESGPTAVVVTGEVRETDVYGADLVLRRSLRFPIGLGVIEIEDEVTNQGYEPAVLMLLYHVNAGYPVVSDDARLIAPPATVVGLDDLSQARLAEHDRFAPPTVGFPPTVYEHRLTDPGVGWATIGIVNAAHAPTDGIALSVSYQPAQLPFLWQWRMLAPGMYLTGLEPANCGIRGRAVERQAGRLDILAPGESRRFNLRLEARIGSAAQTFDPYDTPGSRS